MTQQFANFSRQSEREAPFMPCIFDEVKILYVAILVFLPIW